MLRFLSLLLLPAFALAETPAEALTKLGGKLKETGGHVVDLSIDIDKFTDAEFRLVNGCTKLKSLSVNGKTLTDATLPLLAGLADLEMFSSNSSALTDDGLKHFAQFKNLKRLSLWHPSIRSKDFTGAGVAHLKALPKLERFTIAGTTVGDAMLEGLSQVTQLKEFSTWHTAQTQAGNAHLAKLPNLVALKMGQRLNWTAGNAPPSFDGTTIPTLAKIKSLETLELMEVRLTAKDLEPLKDLPKLKKLTIQTADISEAEVVKVKAMLPNVAITFTPMSDADKEATLVKKLKI